jgi:hypothetical protein
MRAPLLFGLAVLVLLGGALLSSEASARNNWDKSRDRKHHNHDRWENWENRRDARRAGIIAGTVASGIVRSSAHNNAKENYEECMTYYYQDQYYDQYCRDQYYQDMQSGRRAARRAGVVVGLGAREIVRD